MPFLCCYKQSFFSTIVLRESRKMLFLIKYEHEAPAEANLYKLSRNVCTFIKSYIEINLNLKQ